jgi:replicative DNA helicase
MSGSFQEQFAAAEQGVALQNVEAEIGLLGDIIDDNRLVDLIADRLRGRDFSVPLYGRVFDQILDQTAAGANVDAVTLSPHFQDDPEWPRAFKILSAASLNAGPRARSKAYFEQITMLSARRRMVAGLQDVVHSARDLGVTREELLANADEAVAELAEQVVTAQAPVGTYAQAVIDSFGQPVVGVRCGLIASLDNTIGVLRPSNLVVVGGRPGMGKTSLVTSYAIGAASRGHGVLIFSLEMSADELTRRMLADMTFTTQGGVPYEDIRDGVVRKHDMAAVLDAKRRFDDLPLEINETSGLTPSKLIRQARTHKRRLAAKGETLELVVVDYLQLMAHSRKGMSPYEAFVGLTPYARLLFMGIWTECDDMGSFEWSPLKLKMRLLPADNIDAAELLAELQAAGAIMSYEVDGKRYGAVRNFCQYQRPKKPNSVYPQTEAVRKRPCSARASRSWSVSLSACRRDPARACQVRSSLTARASSCSSRSARSH